MSRAQFRLARFNGDPQTFYFNAYGQYLEEWNKDMTVGQSIGNFEGVNEKEKPIHYETLYQLKLKKQGKRGAKLSMITGFESQILLLKDHYRWDTWQTQSEEQNLIHSIKEKVPEDYANEFEQLLTNEDEGRLEVKTESMRLAHADETSQAIGNRGDDLLQMKGAYINESEVMKFFVIVW